MQENVERIQLRHPEGSIRLVELRWCRVQPNVEYTICIDDPAAGTYRVSAINVFEGLIRLREILEPMGWRFLCVGAQRNAWPGGFCGGMGEGLKCYIEQKCNTRAPELRSIFEPIDLSFAATVAEQRSWHTEFFEWFTRNSSE